MWPTGAITAPVGPWIGSLVVALIAALVRALIRALGRTRHLRFGCALWCTTAVLALAPGAAKTQVNLPEIGDPSRGALSAPQERALGEAFLREIRAHLPLLEDPEVLSYLRAMGDALVAQSESGHEDVRFRFFVVDSPTINAFAGPGGIIAVNAGLIALTTNESELASVVAHEIAHVTQRHLARAVETSKRTNPLALAGLLAALILATQNPDVGQAAAASVIAGSVQKRLDFTRQNEKEADRVGIGLLVGAGYDPRSMPTFFERLQQSNRYYTEPPEFLSTHPVTVSRISDSRARAEQYNYRQFKDSIDYLFIKAKVKALSNPDAKAAEAEALESLRTGLHRSEAATRYGYATALMRQKRYADAREPITWLLARHPNRLALKAAMAEIQHRTGQSDQAETIYRDALEIYPHDTLMTHAYGTMLLERERHTDLVTLLEDYLRVQRPRARSYELLAHAYAALGRRMEANSALAERFFLLGDIGSAIHQIEIALGQRAPNEYIAQRAQARREELRAIQRQRAAVKAP